MINIDKVVKTHLIKDIRFFNASDDSDAPFYYPPSIEKEFSSLNKISLTENFLSIKDKCKAILEIGVHRNGTDSSTNVFLDNKNDDTFYFGVDLEDKSYLANEVKNVFTIMNDSSNLEEIMDFVRSKNVDSFDFIFIDGLHSINQVLKDWRFTDFLSSHGIVGLHDTNSHPGPFLFAKNVNLEKWFIDKRCTNITTDWGISFLRKK